MFATILTILMTLVLLVSCQYKEDDHSAKAIKTSGGSTATSFQMYTRRFDTTQKKNVPLAGVPMTVPMATLTKEVPIPYPVAVHIEKPIPYPVKVPVMVAVDRPVPVHVPKPYPVPVLTTIPYPIEKPIPYPVFQPIHSSTAFNHPITTLLASTEKLPQFTPSTANLFTIDGQHGQLFNQQN